MHNIFQQETTDSVILIDATNAFNCMNRYAALHNIQILCPAIAPYLINTYRQPSRLFIPGGAEISSSKGTTQGDPLSMQWYSINTVMIMNEIEFERTKVKQVWLADDAVGAGRLNDLKGWYETLILVGKRHGYYVNKSKCWLIVKPELNETAQTIFNTSINITEDGKRHPGSVIGSKAYTKKYCTDLVNVWINELKVLTEIAITQPQAAYTAYTKGYKSKFSYFLRTIPDLHLFLQPIEEYITNYFLPTLFGYSIPSLGNLRAIFCESSSDGGLAIPKLVEEAKIQYQSSKTVTKIHVASITNQSKIMGSYDEENNTANDLRTQDRTTKREYQKTRRENTLNSLTPEVKKAVTQMGEKYSSAWLNVIPRKELNLDLNKGEFNDALRMRYELPLENLPTTCVCGQKYDVNHAMICKKGGFIAKRHDNIRDLLTVLMNRVCVDVECEPHLQPITNEVFRHRTANVETGARLDIKANYFDVRVTHLNSESNENKTSAVIFREHEMAKKREYLERVIEVEHGSFTPLIFATNGSVGIECNQFICELASKIAAKQNEEYSDVIWWLRVRLSMELMRSRILCVRGSRVLFKKKTCDAGSDIVLENFLSDTI